MPFTCTLRGFDYVPLADLKDYPYGAFRNALWEL